MTSLDFMITLTCSLYVVKRKKLKGELLCYRKCSIKKTQLTPSVGSCRAHFYFVFSAKLEGKLEAIISEKKLAAAIAAPHGVGAARRRRY